MRPGMKDGCVGQDIEKGPPRGSPFPVRNLDTQQYSGSGAAGVQGGSDRGELGVDCIAERAGAGDDGERDESGDQTIFDSGRAGFVLHKTCKKVRHSRAPTPRVTALPSTSVMVDRMLPI